MLGPMLLLAAGALTQPVAKPVAQEPAGFRPTATVSAHATARIMVISGAKFGEGLSEIPASASRRSANLTDYDGQIRSSELLEFQ